MRINFIIDKINLPNTQFFHLIITYILKKSGSMSRILKKMYLGPLETIKTRKTKSKKNIMKVMFLLAFSKPRMDHKRGKYFNGKIGFYPLVEELHSKRNRK